MLGPSNRPILFLTILTIAFFFFAAAPALLQRDLAAEDAETAPRETELCLNCHDGFDKSLALGPHQLPEVEAAEASIACTDCHAGDPRHYEEDPEAFPMTNPSKVNAVSQAYICSSCHQNSHQQTFKEKNVHALNDVNCSGCHKIHDSKAQGLLKAEQFELCTGCHTSVEGQFAQPFRHPVNDGIVKCSECHMTLDETRTELSLNGTNMCTQCHGEFEGPFPYEHQATLDYSTDEGGCMNCHSPHGSAQPRMLTQPYEPPHFQLCTQCHSVPPGHNQNPNHGSMWAGISCNNCHTDIHGSYTSRHFLSEDLEVQGCLKSGCHQ